MHKNTDGIGLDRVFPLVMDDLKAYRADKEAAGDKVWFSETNDGKGDPTRVEFAKAGGYTLLRELGFDVPTDREERDKWVEEGLNKLEELDVIQWGYGFVAGATGSRRMLYIWPFGDKPENWGVSSGVTVARKQGIKDKYAKLLKG